MEQQIAEEQFNLGSISKSRNLLFGIAIILIVLHHLTFKYTEGYIAQAYMFVRALGGFGVDIFLFLSAIGLFYSYSKDKLTLAFYCRRIYRIFPTYLLVAIPWFIYEDILQKGNWNKFIGHITTLQYWIDGSGYWYVSAILLIYLFYPILYKFLYYRDESSKISFIKVFIFYIFFILYLYLLFPTYFSAIGQSISRFPIFLMGMYFAPFVKNAVCFSKTKAYVLCFISFIAGILFFGYLALKGANYAYSFWGRLSYVFVAIPIIIFVSYFFGENSNNSLKRFVAFLGSITLEIYLTNQICIFLCEKICHKEIVKGFLNNYIMENEQYHLLIANILGVLFCYYMSKLINWLLKSNKNRETSEQDIISNNDLNQIKSAIMDYINDEHHRRAIMLCGEWGIGKTYFIKNSIIPELQKIDKYKLPYGTIIYTSLYGINNKNELDESVIKGSVIFNKDIINSDGLIGVLSSIKDAIGFCLDKITLGLSRFLSTIASFLSGDLMIKNLNSVIIFDDIERCKIDDFKELFGAINYYVEQNNKKIIIVGYEPQKYGFSCKECGNNVCGNNDFEYIYEPKASDLFDNDKNESKNENKNSYYRKTYLEEKEKSIGLTFCFISDLLSVYNSIVSDRNYVTCNNTYNYLISNKLNVIEIISRYDNKNLRTFITAIQVFDKFNKILCKAEKDRDFLYFHQSSLFEFICNNVYKHKFYTLTYVYNTVYKYLKLGLYDENKFVNEIKNYKQEYLSINTLSLYKLENWRLLSDDEEIYSLLNSFKSEILSCKYTVNSLLIIFHVLNELKEAEFEFDLKKQIIESISKNFNGNVNDFDNLFLNDHVSEKDLYSRDIISSIRKKICDKDVKNIKQQIINGLNTDWNEDFKKYCESIVMRSRELGFLQYLDINKFQERIKAKSNNIVYLNEGLLAINRGLREYPLKKLEIYENEKKFIEKIRSIINDELQNTDKKIYKSNLCLLDKRLENYEKIISGQS